ncbi:MAG: NINE protein [Bacteroidia bacterium]
MKNKITAALLAFFLGTFGVHRFYLGQGGLGILYFLFFWTGIPSLVSFIDFIVLLAMDEQGFNLKYNPLHYSLVMQQNLMMQQKQTNQPLNAPITPSRTVNISKEIQRLFELKQMGAITEAEYETQKAILLNQPKTEKSMPAIEIPKEEAPRPKDQDEPPYIQGLSPEEAW